MAHHTLINYGANLLLCAQEDGPTGMMFFFFTPAGATYVQKWDPEKERFIWVEMAPIPGSDHEEEKRWLGEDKEEDPQLFIFPEVSGEVVGDAEEVVVEE